MKPNNTEQEQMEQAMSEASGIIGSNSATYVNDDLFTHLDTYLKGVPQKPSSPEPHKSRESPLPWVCLLLTLGIGAGMLFKSNSSIRTPDQETVQQNASRSGKSGKVVTSASLPAKHPPHAPAVLSGTPEKARARRVEVEEETGNSEGTPSPTLVPPARRRYHPAPFVPVLHPINGVKPLPTPKPEAKTPELGPPMWQEKEQ